MSRLNQCMGNANNGLIGPEYLPDGRCNHIHIAHAVNLVNQPTRFVDRKDRRSLRAVLRHTGPDRFFIVIGTAFELNCAAFITGLRDSWHLETIMITFAAPRASISANDPFNQRIFINDEFNDTIQSAITAREQRVKQLRLPFGPGITVKDQALLRWNRIHMFTKDFGHQFVGKELARLHDVVGHFADLCTCLDSSTENIASRKLNHIALLDQTGRLGALACPRRPQQNNIHRHRFQTVPKFGR